MGDKQYRIGIIGIGGISTMHAKAIGDLPNATVVAGVCRTEAKGRQFAEDFDCKWYADAEQMMDEQKPDIVAITTPSGAHLDPVKAAAKRGIHVICEKPLEINVARIDEMTRVADDAGITLGGIFPQRFNPAMLLVREAVAQGRFGNMATGLICVPWWRDDAYYSPDRWQGTLALDGGGALMNQAIHNVDALQWLMAADPSLASLSPDENPVDEVFAYTAKRGHAEDLIEVEDTASAVLKFKNGALAQILAATSMYPGTDRRICLGGSWGTAEVIEEQITLFHFQNEQEKDKQILEQFASQTQATGASDPLAISYEGHTHNIKAFLTSLDAGERPAIDSVQARKAVAIIEAVYTSAAEGKPVKVS